MLSSLLLTRARGSALRCRIPLGEISARLQAARAFSESLQAHDAAPPEKAALPSKATVVIVGGGIIGCSIAYHLTKLGVHDVLLLESGQLTCGTTWHAAGLIGQLRPTRAETEMSGVYGAKLYE